MIAGPVDFVTRRINCVTHWEVGTQLAYVDDADVDPVAPEAAAHRPLIDRFL